MWTFWLMCFSVLLLLLGASAQFIPYQGGEWAQAHIAELWRPWCPPGRTTGDLSILLSFPLHHYLQTGHVQPANNEISCESVSIRWKSKVLIILKKKSVIIIIDKHQRNNSQTSSLPAWSSLIFNDCPFYSWWPFIFFLLQSTYLKSTFHKSGNTKWFTEIE